MPEWYGEMNHWRRVAEYLHTDVITLVEKVAENPTYQLIVARAVTAIEAEHEAREDMQLRKG